MKAMGKSTAISEEQKQEIVTSAAAMRCVGTRDGLHLPRKVAAYCPSDPEAHQAMLARALLVEKPWYLSSSKRGIQGVPRAVLVPLYSFRRWRCMA